MSKAHHNDGPTFRPGTMKMPRLPARSPAREQAEQEQAARDAAKLRNFRERVPEVGFFKALELDKLKR